MYIASFRRKFITDLIQLNGSTHPKFDIWPSRRSKLNLGRPKLEFGSSQEKFDVWPRPKNLSDRFHLRGQQVCNVAPKKESFISWEKTTLFRRPCTYTWPSAVSLCCSPIWPLWRHINDLSLGPGSTVGGKGKKRGQIGKIRRYRRAKRVERWIGEGERAPPFSLPRLPLSSLRSPIFFSFFPQCGAWSQAKAIFVCFPYPRIFPLLLFLPGVKTKWEQS